MKNSFSFPRFWQYAKAEFMSNRKLILILLGAVLGSFMFAYFIDYMGDVGIKVDIEGDGNFVSYYEFTGAIAFSWVVIFIAIFINISRSFKVYFNKGYSTAAMMMPVSLSEKFTYSLVLNSFIVPLVLIALGALTNLIWSASCGIDFRFIADPQVDILYMAAFLLSIMFSISLYFYGSILFRRYQLLFTIVALFAINMVLSTILTIAIKLGFGENFEMWIQNLIYNYDKDWLANVLAWSISIFSAVGLAIMWILSWNRFRKLQITK